MGSLTVVGSGLRAVAHLTNQTQKAIENADIVYYLVLEPITERWILDHSKQSVSLRGLYEPSRPRIDTYREMARLVSEGATDQDVCLVLYGHPGFLSLPGILSLKNAAERGLRAIMLPGISTIDCLMADLGIDFGELGFQSYEATRFISGSPSINPNAHLILTQVGFVGVPDYIPAGQLRPDSKMFGRLVQLLHQTYGHQHRVALYEAAQFPTTSASFRWLTLASMNENEPQPEETLYVPPLNV